MKNAIYILSLILLFVAIYLLIEFPESGRKGLIAGMLTFVGVVLNIVGFVIPKAVKTVS